MEVDRTPIDARLHRTGDAGVSAGVGARQRADPQEQADLDHAQRRQSAQRQRLPRSGDCASGAAHRDAFRARTR